MIVAAVDGTLAPVRDPGASLIEDRGGVIVDVVSLAWRQLLNRLLGIFEGSLQFVITGFAHPAQRILGVGNCNRIDGQSKGVSQNSCWSRQYAVVGCRGNCGHT